MCDQSPQRKRIKKEKLNELKRESESEHAYCKRLKSDETVEKSDVDIQILKRKNFVAACENVSYKAYFNLKARLLLFYLPSCTNKDACIHTDYKNGSNINEIPSCVEETFKIEMKSNAWYEALEVSYLCITPVQYLSANVLKDIVEIILNAHEDDSQDYTVADLIDKCQQILADNFSTHPPCITKKLRKCYNDFLTTSLELKENTFTNRANFNYDKGIVKYCMHRLEYEISSESKDSALVDKCENTPEHMKQSVKGLHWQKEKFEIFELLERPERIRRLMAVLESIIELLQFDLAIWYSRYTHNLGSHIMRSHKPLMAYILWSDNILYTGVVNNNCRQLMRLFTHLVHLQYPEEYIKIMTMWFNAVVQTFYICETNSNTDYPNVGKYCTTFAKEFYQIISSMPHETIIKILERIQPSFMQYLVGIKHIKILLPTQQDDILKILINFIRKSEWQSFPSSNCEIHISKKQVCKLDKIKSILNYLAKKCHKWKNKNSVEKMDDYNENITFRKLKESELNRNDTEIDQIHVVLSLYFTLDAYLETYSVQVVQETLDILNEKMLNQEETIESNGSVSLPKSCSYAVTEHFIKKYRSIYSMLKELVLLFSELKNNEQLPEILSVFENTGLIGV